MSPTREPEVPPSEATREVPVTRYESGIERRDVDFLTIEEPLEIRVLVEEGGVRVRHSLAVTMRTPGQDVELATGFLLSEGVIKSREDVWRIAHCLEGQETAGENVVDVHLAPSVTLDLERLSRNVITTSACGVCGKASIEAVQAICPALRENPLELRPETLLRLPDALRTAQPVFSRTGGLHAAAMFDLKGALLQIREDVGRHNALDKLVGALLESDELPASDRVLLVSGRASFELVQKALMAGLPVLAAVGAPSSLAVDLARSYGMTLIGFLRAGRFNVYSGTDRVDGR